MLVNHYVILPVLVKQEKLKEVKQKTSSDYNLPQIFPESLCLFQTKDAFSV